MVVVWLVLGVSSLCDPLVPEYCSLPFPNDYYRSNETGRLAFGEKSFPLSNEGDAISPSIGGWNELDGFSPLPPITTYIPNLDDKIFYSMPFPRLWDIGASLADSSATMLLNTATGGKIAHWTELDHSSDGDPLAALRKRALIIWPAERLNASTRYVVAIKQGTETTLQTSPFFRSMIDGATSAVRKSRWQHFDQNIFTPLETAGVHRSQLHSSWDFTVGSTRSITGRLVSARDQMLAHYGKKVPKYKIKSVKRNASQHLAAIVHAQVEVPLFLNDVLPVPSSRLVLDDNGLPQIQHSLLPYTVDFEVLIPHSVAQSDTNARVVQYGHGLFGSQSEVETGYLQQEADQYRYVYVATNWVGLAKPDAPGVAAMLGTNMTNFAMVPDRCTQGMVNALAVMHLIKTSESFAKESAFQFPGRSKSAIDVASSTYAYNGNSEGGIFGGVYMALSTDVERGVLGVSGAPYALLLPRSADFADLFPLIKARYADPVDRIQLLSILQLLWDRAEPAGYLHAISREPLPGNKPHQVLIHYGLGDAQVSWLGAHIEGRSVTQGGAYMYSSNVREGNETLFGFSFIDDDRIQPGGNGIQGYNWGAPVAPFINKPAQKATDAHEKPRRDPRAQEMMNLFFRTGQIKNECAGPCVNKTTAYL